MAGNFALTGDLACLQGNRFVFHVGPLETHDNTRLCDPNTYLAKDSNTIAQNLIATLEEICAAKVTGFGAPQAEANCWLILRDDHWYLAIIYL